MSNKQLDAVLSALANPVRRRILEILLKGEMSVGELSEPLSISAPSISRHLKILEETQLIKYEKQTQFRIYSLNEDGFEEAISYLNRYREYWQQQFSALDEQLKKRGEDDASH